MPEPSPFFLSSSLRRTLSLLSFSRRRSRVARESKNKLAISSKRYPAKRKSNLRGTKRNAKHNNICYPNFLSVPSSSWSRPAGRDTRGSTNRLPPAAPNAPKKRGHTGRLPCTAYCWSLHCRQGCSRTTRRSCHTRTKTSSNVLLLLFCLPQPISPYLQC